MVLEAASALVLPALATGVGSLPFLKSSSSATNAAMLYLLSVVAVALIAGLRAGLVASGVSFLGLNFFFTPPLRTFAVAKSEDLLALFTFLAVSVLVATLLTRTLDQRKRAERGEHEARMLYGISSRLLGEAPLPAALNQFARDMVELFALGRCEVVTLRPPWDKDGRLAFSATAGSMPGHIADSVDIPMRTERGSFGHARVYPQPGRQLDDRELALAAAFAGQVALVVEGGLLAEQSRRSQADAETSRVRAALFSSITHDLRTPLAAIKASATSLLDGDAVFDQAQRRDLLTTIAEESDRLNRLIANILSLSRLRAGALALEKTAAPIEDVIEAAVTRLRRRRYLGEVAVRVQIPGGDSIPAVPMDLLQIDQVISNLLENAVKYRGNDSPIDVHASADGPWVVVAVADHGPGIPAEDRERVFEEFYRRDTSGGEGGVGLGLAIARAIVTAHGGTISVGETPGGGATVAFRLPLHALPDTGRGPQMRASA